MFASRHTGKGVSTSSVSCHNSKLSKLYSRRRRGAKQALLAVSALAGLSQLGYGANVTWNGGGTDNSWSTGLNWIGGAAPNANDVLWFDGFAKLTSVNNLAPGFALGGINFNATAGSFSISGASITLNGGLSDQTTLLTQNLNVPIILGGTELVDVVGSGVLSLGGIISDGGSNFGLTKVGNGTLMLAGANTFTGPITINAGVLSIGTSSNLGGPAATGGIIINGGTLRASSTAVIPTSRGITLGPAGTSGSGTFSVASGQTLTYGGIIANNTGGTGTLNKYSFGSLVLTGANTYTGATNIKNGALVLNFGAAGAPATNIIAPTSALTLGGSTAGLGQDSNATVIAVGNATVSSSQTFAGTNIDIGGAVIAATKGASATSQLNLGALTHTLGGTLVVPTLGTPTFGGGNTAFGTVNTSTTVATTNGILGGWAVAGTFSSNRNIISGTDWATVDGSGNIVAYSGYVAAPLYDGNPAGTNMLKTNAAILASTDKNVRYVGDTTAREMRVDADNANSITDINTFAFTNTGTTTSNTLTIGVGNTLRLGVYGGILKQNTGNSQLYIGGAGGVLTGNGSGPNIGQLTAGGPVTGTPGEIVLSPLDTANNNGGMNIQASIVDNGAGGTVTLIKTGVMSVKIDGHNTFTGGVFINQGRFQLAGGEAGAPNPDGLGSGPVTIAPGGYLFVSGVNNATILFNGPGAIPGALANTAQNCPIPNNITISGVGDNQEPIGAIRLGSRSLLSGQITLAGDARIGGSAAAAYPAINPDGTTLYVDPGNQFSGKITGPFSFDIGAAVSINTNFMISNPANDWSGNTNLIAPTASGSITILRLGNNEVIPDGVGKGNLNFGNAGNANNAITLDMNGFSETVNGLSTANSANPSLNFIQNNGFTATISGDPGSKVYNFTASTSMLTVGGFDQTATFAGIIRDSDTSPSVTLPDPNGGVTPVAVTAPWANVTSGSPARIALTKIGNGLQTLSGSNTYTGGTNVNGGTLSITGSLANSGTVQVNSGGALAGTGNVGNVTVASGGHTNPGAGGAGTTGTLSTGSFVANQGSVLHFDMFGGLNDGINAQNVTLDRGTGSITIAPNGSPAIGTTYTLISSSNPIVYSASGSFNVTAFPTIPNTRPAAGVLVQNTNSLQFNVTSGAETLTWSPGGVNNNWELIGTANFKNHLNATDQYFNGDIVTFDNSATNKTVNIVGNLEPGAVNINNDSGNDYVWTGPGSITGVGTLAKNNGGVLTVANTNNPFGTFSVNSGTVNIGGGTTSGSLGSTTINMNGGSVVFNRSDDNTNSNIFAGGGGRVIKNGSNTVTLAGASTYTGEWDITAGTVVATNGNGTLTSSFGSPTNGAVNVANGAAIDLVGAATADSINLGTREIRIIGAGPSGAGAIVNSGTLQQINALGSVRLDGNATIGGTARFDIRNASGQLNLNNFTLTKIGATQFSLVGTNVSNSGTVLINTGTLSLETTTNFTGTDKHIVLKDNTRLQIFNLGNGTNNGSINSPIIVDGTGIQIGNGNANPSLLESPITMNQNLTVTSFGGAGAFTMSGTLTEAGGARSLTKAGNGTHTLILMGNGNSWTGGTTISAGTIQIGTGGSDGSIGSGLITNNANLAINRGDTISLGSNIGGTGAVHQLGSGTTILNGNLSYTGVTNVLNGRLFVNGGHGGGGAYTVSNGTLGTGTLGGIGSISAAVTVQSGAGLSPGSSVGALTVGSLAMASGSNIQYEFDSSGGDGVNVSSTNGLSATASVNINLNDLGGTLSGRYPLIDYNGTPLADLSAFNLQNGSVGGHNATLINNTAGTSVDLLLDGTGPLQAMWMTDGNGDWNNAGNWSPSVPSGAGNIAYFGSITSAPRAITVSSPQTVAKMIFNNSAAGYTVSGSAVTLDSPNPAVGIDVLGGNHTVASPVVMNQDSTMYVQAASSLTISGNVSSAAGKGLTKTGPGLLTLSGANTYSGPTSVNRGTLRLNGTHTGGGAYSIASGAALGGTGSTDAQVNVSPGGIVAPGASVGVLTVASLSLSSSLLNFEADGSGVDRLNVTSTNGLTLAGVSTFSLTNLGGAVSGTFTLIDYAGTPLANLTNFALGTTSLGGLSLALVNNTANTSIDLAITSSTVSASWNVDASGNWSLGTNWTGGSAPNGVDNVANFGSIITAPRTVTVDAPQTVGAINFNSVQSYTIAGSSPVTLDVSSGQAAVNVVTGSHTISAPVVLNKDTTITSATGTGVAFTGNLTATGKAITKAGAGTAQFENVRAATLNITGGSAKISTKGTANSAAGTSVVNSLSISSGASLDLANNSMIVDYTGPVGTQVTDIRGHLRNGRLTTSSGTATTRLGYGDNAVLNKSTFAGQSVDTSSILVKYTYAGDADLDGDADGVDIGTWATNFTGELGGTGSMVWTQGDWDYDGDVDGVDAGLWAQAFTGELGGGGLGSLVVDDPNIAPGAAAILRGMGISVVPEPATVGLLGLVLAGAASRRSRRQRRPN